MKSLLTIVLLIVSITTGFGQANRLSLKFSQADSVLLISHLSVPGSSIRLIDSLGRDLSAPLFIKGKLNSSSIQEKAILNTKERRQLAAILNFRKDHLIEQSNCSDPHHAILLYRTGKLSYIDLCFSCVTFDTSKDIDLVDIERETWIKLHRFFKEKGLKYKMDVR